MKFIGKIVLIVLASQGVISEDIERLTDASISKAIGENVTIVCNITGITASVRNPLNIIISRGKGDLNVSSIVLRIIVSDVNSVQHGIVEIQSAYVELGTKSTAIYKHTGKSSDGQETARVSFTITDLSPDDEGSYLLTAKDLSFATYVSVNYGPEKCGSGLQSEYIVNSKNQLNITSGFCGKPQPTVTCTFDGTAVSNVFIAEVSQYNYTYTVSIPNLEPCDKKELRCTVTGFEKPFIDSAIIHGESPEKKKVSGSVCAGHIVGFEIGVILLCGSIYLYLVNWNATTETWKLTGFIIAVILGLALGFWLSVSYADLRDINDNHNCGKRSLDDCDKAFIAFGVIDFAALVIVAVIVVVKVCKGSESKTSDQSNGSQETTPLQSSKVPDGEAK